MAPEGRLRIAILGGGMGGLTAAWSLASEPDAEERYSITVYERSARLGGKGASGRDVQQSHRVLEHGLHVLMGFYHESFRLLRDVYQQVEGLHPGAILPWEEALIPWDSVTMADPTAPGRWGLWRLRLPANARRPGEGASAPAALTELVPLALRWYESFRKRFYEAFDLEPIAPAIVPPDRLTPEDVGPLQVALRASLQALSEQLRPSVARLFDAGRRAWIAAWFAGANALGALDSVLFQGFDAIEDLDYRAWLGRYAPPWVPKRLTTESPPVDALYDLAFSHGRTLGAGTTLRVVLRMLLDYEGHVAYKLNGGMGDVVFAPLLLALRDRGVAVRLRHEVVGIELDPDRDRVARIRMARGTDVVSGAELDFPACLRQKGLDLGVWLEQPTLEAQPPDEPDPVLVAGRDFDVAVLAIPVGAHLAGPFAFAGALAQRNPAFGRMARGLATVPTQALHLWLDADLASLGWPHGPDMLISYTRPFNSWVDMSHVTRLECWPQRVPTLAYFCDALPDADIGSRPPQQVVDQNADDFIAGPLRALWPKLRRHAIRSRYTRANVEAWERYVLAEAGTAQFRLAPDGSGFHNLALAGDWVRTRYNAGCLEAAVLGGLGAADAIRSGRIHA